MNANHPFVFAVAAGYILPSACLSLEFLVKQSAWTWLDAAKVVLMVGSLFQ